MDTLRQQLTAYYSRWRYDQWDKLPADALAVRREIVAAMDAYAAAHPDEHPSLLKARLHEEIAERFVPVLFPHSPFFFEMGVRLAENWGTPYPTDRIVGAWLLQRQQHIAQAHPAWANVQALNRGEGAPVGVWNVWSWFDLDHHSLGYTRVLAVGINGLLAEIAARRAAPCDAEQAANLEAMARGCRALLRIAARFGAAARARQAQATDAQSRRFLAMIAEAATHVPAEPPRTFYEGLAMCWFLREATASLEAIGISVVGHLDRLLYPLYAADLAAGRLTEADAADLLARWMLPTDIKFHVEDSSWPETSTCLELGGCDRDGTPVWNDLTRLFIATHQRHRLMNPKLNCRISADAPHDYLQMISETILAGHNHFALINDDVLIPSFQRAGKSLEEARLYVNGGCQESIVEGVEHSAGAYYYFCLPRVLDLSLRPPDALPPAMPDEARRAIPPVLPDAETFDELYANFMASLCRTIGTGAAWLTAVGREQPRIHPCPLFSTTLSGCIEQGRDYTAGGAKYNPSGIALVGLGTTIDALYAMRRAVYEERWLTMPALRACLARNWAGDEALRARLQRLPRFGHGHPEVDALAARFARELATYIRTLPSERGGYFQTSFFVYYAFQWFADTVRALPDGRHAGDLLSQGIAPGRDGLPPVLPDIFHSLSRIDFVDFPSNAVLDVLLPTGAAMPPDALVAAIRTFARLGGPTLQANCLSPDTLRAAQRTPEHFRDLTVRICGLSAHFVSLDKTMQDEIIDRAVSAI